MPGLFARVALLAAAVAAATHADAQSRRAREPREVEHPLPPPSVDRRDSVVAAAGAYSGRPYWLALAQCGGIYFQLNLLYADAAAHARVIKPDPRATAEDTRKLKEAIKTATAYFDGATRFLMTDRNIERNDAVLTYDPQSRAAGEQLKSIEAALAAARACPALYQACQAAYPKACSEPLAPLG